MQDLERKIELFNGTIIVGRNPDGAVGMLQMLLQSTNIKKILELADLTQWQLALSQLGAPKEMAQLELWAQQQPNPAPCQFDLFNREATDWWEHYQVRQALHIGLSNLEYEGVPVETWGYGFVMRCGDDILMPDLYVGNPNPNRTHEYHYDGPAELIVEVLKSDSRDYDCTQQLAIYQKHQAGEIWLIDPVQKRVEAFSRQENGLYQHRFESQMLESSALPFRLNVAVLFDPENKNNPVETTLEMPTHKRSHATNPELGWTWLTELQITPEPQYISTDVFMTFVPEVKFEGSNRKLEVGGGGWKTTKELLQLLMFALGLRKTLGLLSMLDWVNAMNKLR
jgi:Putative restriction endonuclease